MSYKLNDKEFTDKPSYNSPRLTERAGCSSIDLDRIVDDWQQSDLVDNIGYNLDN